MNFCSSVFKSDEDESSWNDDDEQWEEEEDVEVCKDHTIHIRFDGVTGLDRYLDISDEDHEILVINSEGLWKVKNPYLDHPKNLRNIYKWLEKGDLVQP
jgi:hypothetical protein